MLLDDLLHDDEAEPGPHGVAGLGVRRPEELGEEAALRRLGDADPRVADLHADAAALVAREVDPHLPSVRRVLDRVRDQVLEQMLQPSRVPLHRGEVAAHDREVQPLLVRAIPEGPLHLPRERGQVDRLEARSLAGPSGRALHQLVDELAQPPHAALGAADVLLLRVVERADVPSAHHVQHAHDGGERRPEIVGDPHGEALLLAPRLLDGLVGAGVLERERDQFGGQPEEVDVGALEVLRGPAVGAEDPDHLVPQPERDEKDRLHMGRRDLLPELEELVLRHVAGRERLPLQDLPIQRGAGDLQLLAGGEAGRQPL